MSNIIGTNLVGRKVEIIGQGERHKALKGKTAVIVVVYTEKTSDNVLFALSIEEVKTGKLEIVEPFYTNEIVLLSK